MITAGVLPPVKGLYEGIDSDKPVDAVLISHPHQDHYGLVRFLRKSIPVYLGEETHKVLEVSDLFLPIKAKIKRPVFFKDRVPFQIGPFKITPYLMDHSAFGAYAFLIEADGRSLFYSGDLRGHGRKARLFKKFIRTAPPIVDCLLMEGTTLNRTDKYCETEEDLEEKIVKIAKKYANIKLLYTSGQNIDRMVTFYKAALRTRSLFVVDLYTAYLLDELKTFARIPYPHSSFKNLRVFFSKKMTRHLYRQNRKDIVYKFRPFEISIEELKVHEKGTFLIFRGSLLDDIKQIGDFKSSVLIYSMFKGYMQEPRFEAIKKFLKEKMTPIEILHTSGHASTKDLQALAEALSPKMLVPIHTLYPGKYQELFRHVHILKDGEVLTL